MPARDKLKFCSIHPSLDTSSDALVFFTDFLSKRSLLTSVSLLQGTISVFQFRNSTRPQIRWLLRRTILYVFLEESTKLFTNWSIYIRDQRHTHVSKKLPAPRAIDLIVPLFSNRLNFLLNCKRERRTRSSPNRGRKRYVSFRFVSFRFVSFCHRPFRMERARWISIAGEIEQFSW